MLGVGDFYYELGVQIIEVCMATNHRNGGMLILLLFVLWITVYRYASYNVFKVSTGS